MTRRAAVAWRRSLADRHAGVPAHWFVGNLTADAHLATIAGKNGGAEQCSGADLNRYPKLRWLTRPSPQIGRIPNAGS